MKKRKIVMSVLIVTMLASCMACGNIKDHKDETLKNSVTEKVTVSNTEVAEDTENIEPVDIKIDDLKPLADAGVITGVEDIIVPEGKDVNLNELVYADKNIVKSVDIDDSAVDYSKAGTYEVIYTITFNGEKLRDYVKENNLNVNFDTNDKTIVVKTKVTITVATEEDTEKAIADGNTNVVTPKTKESVAESNKAKANDNAVASKPAEKTAKKPAGNTGNNKPTEKPHVHKYVEISRTDPTCTTDGVITKKCSCGDVITESNGKALGHNMVHHDAVTHTEQKLVKDAYDEPIYKNGYQCNVCGKFFNTDDEAGRHVLFECTKGATYSTAHNIIVGYTHHDAVYETVTITDVEAYNECSRCGAR